MSIFQNVTVNNYAISKFFTTTTILEGTWVLETPYLLLQVLLLQMFSNGNWSRKSLFSGNNEQIILAHSKFFTTTTILEGTWVLETPYLLLQVLLLQMFSNGNWSRKSLFSGNNEQIILAQIYKLKLEVIQVKGHEET